MTDAIEKLQHRLRTLNQSALARIRPGDALQMRHERDRLQEWVRGSAQLEVMAASTIEGALRAFRQNKYLKGARQIKLLCYGCTQRLDGGVLIESRQYFDILLENVVKFSDRRHTFRKFYRGLLNGYFSYDPYAPETSRVGRGNWERLRAFLAEHLDTLPRGAFIPDWLLVLSKYPALLAEQPARFLGGLQGDGALFNVIRECLEVNVDSWLVRESVMAPVMAAGDMDDAAFREQLDGMLLLLSDYPLYAAAGLKVLLDRYALCEGRVYHAALLHFAVGLWGNPWLPEHAHQWQCGESAREMLANWLKHHLLSDFFGFLSKEEIANSRRMNFWELYSEDLTGLYFALGKEAFAFEDAHMYQFRTIAKGLLVKLAEEKRDVHICIMQFDRHHVVEFNRETNAAYFYDTRQGIPAFYFSQGWVEVGAISVSSITEGVDVARLSKPLRHQDSRRFTWEGRFAQEMGATENAVRAFCRKYRCQYEFDLNRGQWISPEAPDQYGQQVWSVLAGWGFDYSVKDRKYFCRNRPAIL